MILKGSERKTVILRTGESGLFEEAIFLLRESPRPAPEAEELAAEAGRIIRENLIVGGKGKKEKKKRRLLFFLLGAGFGSALTALLFLVL